MGASKGTKYSLNHTPGFSTFKSTGYNRIRCLWGGNNRLFAIADDHVIELAANGDITDQGAIGSSTNPGQIVSNGNQLLVWDGTSSGANTWLLTGNQAPFVVVSSVGITYIDGYFVALRPAGADYACDPVPVVTENGNQFNLSPLLNGFPWDPLQYAVTTASPDQGQMILGPGSFNGGPEELWIMKKKTIEVWYDTGGTALNPFPFERVHGAFINCGVWAKFSIAGFPHTIVFLGADDRGVGMVFKMNGYTPERISNHALENAIRGYIVAGSDISNAIGYAYQENGHTFYVLTFPTANRQWVYDFSTDMWHQRSSGTSKTSLTAPPAMFHAFVFGKHLVADLNSGVIYQTSLDVYQQAGADILRMRIAPHINRERKLVTYPKLQLDFGGPFDVVRTWTLENSNDGGFNYGTAKSLAIGPAQQSTSRMIYRQLGQSRDRVFRIASTDNLPVCLVDGYVDFEDGTGG